MAGFIIEILVDFSFLFNFMVEGAHSSSFAFLPFTSETLLSMSTALHRRALSYT